MDNNMDIQEIRKRLKYLSEDKAKHPRTEDGVILVVSSICVMIIAFMLLNYFKLLPY